jgi:hypothetical protein
MFAEHFSNIYKEASNSENLKAVIENTEPADAARHSDQISKLISVELVDSCIAKLKLGKACGPDDLSAEHLEHGHPSLIAHLCCLFKLKLAHRYVPNGFGKGTIIPLVEDKSRNLNDVKNYRAITLIPIISKVFEHIS